MQKAPSTVGLMVLLPDGTVLAQNNGGTAWYRLTPDSQGHYATGTWSTITPMHDSRLYCATQVLKDGRIFVAGGEYGSGHTTAEVYNPLADAWTECPNPSVTFSDANSEILSDGRVLVALVQGTLRQTIIYDPVANTWTNGPTANGIHNESMWVKQPDDSILFVDRLTTNSERYIPSLNQWITDASLPVSIYDPYGLESGPGFLLPNGKSIFLGATGHTAIYTPSGSTTNGSWIAGPDIPNASGTPDAPGAMMPTGVILCAVSPVPTSANHFPTPTTFYEYDYVANTFTPVGTPTGGTMSNPSYYGTMLVVPDGTVLYSNFGNQVYNYQPSGSPLAAGKPTISSITQNTDGSFHLIGTQLNGISEGSAYGDDNQNATNYPIVRLTSSGGTVYFARTYNWTRTSVQTGSASVSTEFALPAGLPAETYSLAVIANGIPSDPTSFVASPIIVSLPASIMEGTIASGTVTLPTAPSADTVVNLSTSNSNLLTVSSSVTVPAGQTSASFTLTAPEQAGLIGTQSVAVTAAATGYQTGIGYIRELDDKSAVLAVSPVSAFSSSGVYGGPFTPSSATYTLTNTGNFALNWTASKGTTWLTLSATSGSLGPGANTTVTVSINTSVANLLSAASYTDTVLFTNATSGTGNTSIAAGLNVTGAPVMVVSGNSLNSAGPAGGPFVPGSTVFKVQNTGNGPMSWTATKTASWLTISPASGVVQPNASTNVTVTVNTNANPLAKGAYNDTITFTNTTNSVGNATSSALLIVDQASYTNTIDTDPGWSRQGEWAWGPPTGGGGGNGFHDPTAGATGTNVFGVNLAGNYSLTPGGPFYLVAGPFNLTGNAATRLRFARWLNTDMQPYAFATVDVSNDGTNWTNVWNNGTAAVADAAWQTAQYDISNVADNQSAVYVRWGYQIASGALAYSGWNIDDVRILGTTNGIAPTGNPQIVPVLFGTAKSVTLSGTDTNTPVQPLTFNVVTQPQHGTISGTVPNLTYTPAAGFQGADNLTFTCTNQFNLTSAPATVTFNVSPSTPVANSQRVNATVNTAATFSLSGNDLDIPPLPLTYQIQSQPTHGVLSGTAPNLTYTPAPNFQGTDSFSFTVSNGVNTSVAATVSIFVGVSSVVDPVMFADASSGIYPGVNPRAPLVIGTDGNFYGTTRTGGASNLGAVFKMTSAGVITTLTNFYGANGAWPQGGLVQGSDGNFYGTTTSGGANNLGTVFRITPTGTLTTLVNLTNTTGTVPDCALLLANDGNFYGTTSAGGTSSAGTIFKMTPAGVLTVLVNFTSTSGAFPGSSCQAPLIQGTDGLLYGVTSIGGAGNFGTVFKVSTSGVFTSLAAFTGSSGATLGSSPLGALVQASDGNFYGTTSTGGTSSAGTIFKITSGGVFTSLVTFTGTSGAAVGATPQAAMVQWTDGNLYGTTRAGGTANVGTLFKVSTAGTFTNLRSLSATNDGSGPYAPLVLAGDGSFYSTTNLGGAAGVGAVFSYAPSSGTYNRLVSFTITPPWIRNLFLATDGNYYGLTYQGGANALGSVIKISPTAGGSTLISFSGTNGSYPTSLMQGSDGNLYGATLFGGSGALGTVFQLTTGGALTTLVNFSGTSGNAPGSQPFAAITQGSDGALYGTTQTGGTSNIGSVWKVTTAGAFTSLASFTGTTGAVLGQTPQTQLIQSADGSFYGTTSSGGTGGGVGTIFKVTSAGVFTSLVSFTGSAGAVLGTTPSTNLTLGPDGNFYGTTVSGGANNFGSAYMITPAGAFNSLGSFTGNGGAAPGASPTSHLLLASDGNFYGTTSGGGAAGVGTVYRLAPGAGLTSVAALTGVAGALPGGSPSARLMQGADGWLYGSTTASATYGVGSLFRVSMNGSSQSLYIFGGSNDGGAVGASQSFASSQSYQIIAGSDGYLYGGNQSLVFRLHQQPAVQSLAASSVNPTDATVSATIVPNQDSAIVYFQYGLTASYGNQTSQQILAPGSVATLISALLGGLQPGQVYHFRIVIVTAQGTFYSIDQTFATPGAPLVVTGSVAGAGQTGLSLDGQVNPLGSGTTWYFAYGPDTNYLFQTPAQNAGNGIATVPVSTAINGLSPNTTYHIRLVATNSYGTTMGDDQIITTLPAGLDLVQPAFLYLNTPAASDAGLVLGNDGNFYGTSNNGGTHNSGTAFQVTPGGTLRILANFAGGNDGLNPQAPLVQGPDGNYYGTTLSGGTYGQGSVYMVSPQGEFTTLASLNSTTGTSPIAGLVVGPDNSLYGVCQSGGTVGSGTAFKVTLSGTVTTLANFNGSNPRSALVLGSDGNFYGTAVNGGSSSAGIIFKMTPAGTVTTLVNFTGATGAALGSGPLGQLVQGPDGNFYGTTSAGGTGGFGTVFVMTPAGAFTSLVSFTGTSGSALGTSPRGTLALGADGSFYGATQSGGTGGFGTIFKVTPGGVLTTLANFTGTTGTALGSAPFSGLTAGNDGNFYGTCSSGDLYSQGNVFKVTPDGVVTTLVAFNFAPTIGKLAQGNDGNLYTTTTAGGGSLGAGLVLSGPPGGAFQTLATLVPTVGTAALNSQGGFIQASDGNFYATSQAGGVTNNGSVFKLTSDGVLSTLLSFTGSSGGALGSAPRAALVQGSDGNLWGTTSTGGNGTGNGSIFKLTTSGVETSVLSFSGTTGSNLGSSPQGPLTVGLDGNFYGTTTGGGTNGFGTVFKVTPAGVQTTLVNFTGTAGSSIGSTPSGFLVQGNDGNFYGTTQSGAAGSLGSVFRVTPAGVFTSLASFTGTAGALPGQGPVMGLVKGQDGYLYGTTGSGGLYSLGTIFRVNGDGTVVSLYSFTGNDEGLTPGNGLTVLADGSIYGVDNLAVYQLNPPPATTVSPATNVLANSATLNGSVTPEAGSASAYFEYGTTTAYGATTAPVNFAAGYIAHPISANLTGLQPFLTYHYRLDAANNTGVYPGGDATFSTPNVATFNSAADVPVTIGDFVATGLPLNVVLGFAPALGTNLTLVRNTGAHAITGTFTGLPEGAAVSATFGGQTYLFQISYVGGDGNDITLTNVPQSITFPTIPNKATTDPAFTLAATASSALPVTYTVLAGSSVATVSGSTVTLTGTAGVVTIVATQPGNGSIGAAPPVYQTFAVSSASPFVQIVSSKYADFTLGIRADGTLWAWGLNGNGQLGIGNTATTRVPVQVGTATNWQSVSAGGAFAMGVRTDGTLWAWGLNSSGQVGDGSTTQRNSPVQITGTWKVAVAGNTHAVAVKSDGTLWAWGSNSNAQLGQGTTDTSTHPSPMQVGAANTWGQTRPSLTAGTDFTLALQTDGSLWGWGFNSNGQLGDGTSTSPRPTVERIGTATTWNSVAAGVSFAVATRADGTIWTWGLNSGGQLGDSTTITRVSPTQFTSLANVQAIVPGGSHVLAVLTNGTLWSWGSNNSGQLGLNVADTAAHGVPAQVGSMATWQILAPGSSDSIAVTNDKTVWAWGGNNSGQLGYLPRIARPIDAALGPVAFASGGNAHGLAILEDGTLWGWGSNGSGQLGLGSADTVPHPAPVQMGVGFQWISASAGSSYTLAVRADGTLWACGINSSGQLGDYTTSQRTSLVQIGTDNQWQFVSAGTGHSLAIKTDGTLWGWGTNGSGQLGDGTTTPHFFPQQIGTATNWVSAIAAANGSFSLALKADHTLWAWGLNSTGQLGDGTTNSRFVPGQVGTSTWTAYCSGNANTIAVRTDGTLWGWGANGGAQIGDGSFTQRNSPVQIGTSTAWTSVAGNGSTVATRSDGTLWSWGSDSNGQLGDAGTTTLTTPAKVGTSTAWASVALLNQSSHSLAITADGTLWGFGFANSGQIGLAWRNQLAPEVAVPALSAPQTISFSLPANVAVGTPVTLAATTTSGLPAAYIVNGPAVVSNGQLTPTGPGVISVLAYQPGDNYWQASDVALRVVNVTAPVIATPTVIAVTTTTATLSGKVNPSGAATTAKFQSGATNLYGTDTPIALNPSSGLVPQTAGAVLTGLTPGSTYHVRISATNGVGTSNSSDVTFTTVSTNANLSGLVLSTGAMTPAFTAGNLNYSAVVPHGTTAVTVTPTTQDPTATVQVRANGNPFVTVDSGTESSPLTLGAGATSIDVLVTAGDGVTTQLYNVSASIHPGYDAWAASHGLTGPLSGQLSDFDGDGVVNLLEWAFGMNAIASDDQPIRVSGGTIANRGGVSVIVTGSGVNAQYFALFGRRDEYLAAGLSYTVQFSSDLQNWVTSNATPTVVADDGEIQAVTVPAPAAQNGKPFGFVRLQITGPN